nr:double-stranded RNA-binding-like domain-containing protein [Tanacetum cinerariifolium]
MAIRQEEDMKKRPVVAEQMAKRAKRAMAMRRNAVQEGTKVGKVHNALTVSLVPGLRGAGTVSARVPKKVMEFAGFDDKDPWKLC